MPKVVIPAQAGIQNDFPFWTPAFEKEDEEALYDYCTELFRNHAIGDATYERAKKLFGVPGVVELTALIGYYGMVAMTLLAHEMPLPQGVKPPLAKRK